MSLSSDYVGSILLAAFNFAPTGYDQCNGQSLSISSNAALFSLLGTTYGGDGVTTFKLPNFQGRVPFGVQGSSTYVLGATGGSDSVTLTQNNLPPHTHSVTSASISAPTAIVANQVSPEGGYFATSPTASNRFAAYTDEHMAATSFGSMTSSGTYSTGPTGGNQPYDKRMPFTTILFCIAVEGVYPSRT
jgi:microcystin-dependent protein